MKKLKIYFAAAWGRRDEIRQIVEDLQRSLGIQSTSRWLYEPTSSIKKGDGFRRRRAQEDVQDVLKADMLVRFSDDLSGRTVPAKLATGSRMFEMGLAYRAGKKIVVCGGHQPIFDYLPGITHVRHLGELKTFLQNRRK